MTDDFTTAVKPMTEKMDTCETDVPASGDWDGYTGIGNATCSFCAKKCNAPDIDSSVGFFDGFAGRSVWITYVVIIAFTVVW